MLTTLAVANYRSLRDLQLPLAQLNVVRGSNGSGKSSVYRALRLLAQTAQGRVIPALALEGGLPSTLWAGPERITRAMRSGEHAIEGSLRKSRINLRLGFASETFGYLIDLGLPPPVPATAFALDPEIKLENLWAGPVLRPAALLVERRGPLVRVRDAVNGIDGWRVAHRHLASFDSMLTELSDPQNAPEMFQVREMMRGWRFYDHIRTDADAPVRQPQIGTRTPVLGDDGRDLAAAWQTVAEIGDTGALAASVEDAFPGATVDIAVQDGRFALHMRQPGLLRPLQAAELSDGTLRYLLWIAALLSPRPPALLVLNEPENSLHPDLLPALGRLIRRAARHTQVIVVSHAARLIATLEEETHCRTFVLDKDCGETKVADTHWSDSPAWRWPTR